MSFASTDLPVLTGDIKKDEASIRKSILDLLDKINTTTTIHPIPGKVSSDDTYIVNGLGIQTVLIKASSLKASSGGPYRLTITSGTGSNVIVPIAASTDTILSGDLLFDIYIDSSGNVVSKAWTIEAKNTNGYYVISSCGNMNQSGVAAVTTNTAYAGAFFYSSTDASVTFPKAFVGDLPTVVPSAQLGGSVGSSYLSDKGLNPLTLSGCGVNVLTSNNATSYSVYWKAFGRWR